MRCKGVTLNCEKCEGYWRSALVYWKDLSILEGPIVLYCPYCKGDTNVQENRREAEDVVGVR